MDKIHDKEEGKNRFLTLMRNLRFPIIPVIDVWVNQEFLNYRPLFWKNIVLFHETELRLFSCIFCQCHLYINYFYNWWSIICGVFHLFTSNKLSLIEA